MKNEEDEVIPLEPERPAGRARSRPASVVLVRHCYLLPRTAYGRSMIRRGRPAIPVEQGLRCSHEGCVAGAGWAVGDWAVGRDGGVAADGLGVVDCSIGFAPFC